MSLASHRISRRRLMRNTGIVGAVAIGAPTLAACGTDPVDSSAQSDSAEDLSDSEQVLQFDNWPLYIDVDEEDENVRPTLAAFEADSGVDVTYVEAVNDNDEYFAKISPQLSAGQPIAADVFVVTDWMVARLISLGWLQELDQDNLTTVEQNIDDALRSPSSDPDRMYSVPWQSGITGIAYNAAAVPGGVTSIDQLLTDPALAGKVTLFSGMRESLPILAGAQGNGLEGFTDADVDAALAQVEAAVDAGQIRRFTGNDYADDLAQGNVVAALAWSGDVAQLQFDNPDLKFVVPDEGGELWSDNMVVPVGASHKTNVETMMDWYYNPEIAADLANWVGYICPVPAAKDVLLEYGDEFSVASANSPLVFPSADDLSNVAPSREITEDEEARYETDWNAVILT